MAGPFVDVPAGSLVAGYRIESVIGRGGMGVVYRARHLALGRAVALKVVAPEIAGDPEFRERFVREARLAASLDHPNVVPVYDAGESRGRLYIAMRYVAGTDLQALLAAGPLEPRRALAILWQVARALDAAHGRGLVHRDVKPANILVGRTVRGGDRAYLSDFGLTKRTGSRTALTQAGLAVGTVSYAAPEQLLGREVDGRADVYSLGCVLYECLAGAPPFGGDTDAQVIAAQLFDQPPALSTRRAGLPSVLDTVMARAVAKAPEDRHPMAVALIEAAGRALGAPAPEVPPTRTMPAVNPTPAPPGSLAVEWVPPQPKPSPASFPPVAPRWAAVRARRSPAVRVLAAAVALVSVAVAAVGLSSRTAKVPTSFPSAPAPSPRAPASPAAAGQGTGGISLARFHGRGFSIAFPDTWNIDAADHPFGFGSGRFFDTTIVDPKDGLSLIRVDVSPRSAVDAPALAGELRAAHQKRTGYHELAFRRVPFQGGVAVLWEFVDEGSGVAVHKVDLFFTRAGSLFAVLTEARQSKFEALHQTFDRIRAGVSVSGARN